MKDLSEKYGRTKFVEEVSKLTEVVKKERIVDNRNPTN